jgi:hypothetical protein
MNAITAEVIEVRNVNIHRPLNRIGALSSISCKISLAALGNTAAAPHGGELGRVVAHRRYILSTDGACTLLLDWDHIVL